MKPIKITFWLCVFAISMAFLESAVVVYLRLLYYPDGFGFPLVMLPAQVGLVEVLREFSTVILLISGGILAGKTRLQRFAYFVLAFAVWDLFYYFFLYLLIGWPAGLGEWDILFLIPVPWVGPVWAPCLLCLLMIGGALYIITAVNRRGGYSIRLRDWFMMIGGALTCIIAFMWDYLAYTWSSTELHLSASDQLRAFTEYIPGTFNTPLFLSGFFLMSASIYSSIQNNNHEKD